MKQANRIFLIVILLAKNAGAFSLLGPFAPWMTTTNGYSSIPYSDIGGPMSLGEEYRWNVPVVTYGFDENFLDYFGTNGVSAVEDALAILNNLPLASQLDPSSYPTVTTRNNYPAQSGVIFDLKSTVLMMLLDELGLAPPTRNIFDVRQFDPFFTPPYSHDGEWPPGTIPNYIIERNFDPQTQTPSRSVNGTTYGGWVVWEGLDNGVQEFALDPTAPTYSAVADRHLGYGQFFSGLTRDDIGGLRYLAHPTNVNYEVLLSGVHGAGTNASDFVSGAWRPGINKITFIPQQRNSSNGQFVTMTNQFVDKYIVNDVTKQQLLERVINQPDLLFSAADLGSNDFFAPDISRTGTANWINLAAANGNPSGAGPGVIQPPITIELSKMGEEFSTYGWVSDDSLSHFSARHWGRFDASTNAPVILRPPVGVTNQTTVRTWLLLSGSPRKFEWRLSGDSTNQFSLQTSTNLTFWISLATLTNDGVLKKFEVYSPSSQQRYYRLLPQ